VQRRIIRDALSLPTDIWLVPRANAVGVLGQSKTFMLRVDPGEVDGCKTPAMRNWSSDHLGSF
jgi:hypothetical protein